MNVGYTVAATPSDKKSGGQKQFPVLAAEAQFFGSDNWDSIVHFSMAK